jgi:hypothetical protein
MKKVLYTIILLTLFIASGCVKKAGNGLKMTESSEPTKIVATLVDIEVFRTEDGFDLAIVRTVEFRPLVVTGVFAEKLKREKIKFIKGDRVAITFRHFSIYLLGNGNNLVVFNTLEYMEAIERKDVFMDFFNYKPPYYFD